MRIGSADALAGFIAAQPAMRDLLAAVAGLGLPDAWIGAGFVRNPVGDALHGRTRDIAGLADVDVMFFDPLRGGWNASESAAGFRRNHRLEWIGIAGWFASDYARMHRRNADPPYHGTADAVRHWPETATAVAARLRAGQVEMLAPHGAEDLSGLVLRPMPAMASHAGRMDAYRRRVRSKDWVERWPGLTVLGMEE